MQYISSKLEGKRNDWETGHDLATDTTRYRCISFRNDTCIQSTEWTFCGTRAQRVRIELTNLSQLEAGVVTMLTGNDCHNWNPSMMRFGLNFIKANKTQHRICGRSPILIQYRQSLLQVNHHVGLLEKWSRPAASKHQVSCHNAHMHLASRLDKSQKLNKTAELAANDWQCNAANLKQRVG